MAKASKVEVRGTFHALVNMSSREIEDWHKTGRSKSVGQDFGGGVSIGVKAGQRTLQLLRIKRAPNADDIKHMRRVISFVKRLRTQAPRTLALALCADELGSRSAEA